MPCWVLDMHARWPLGQAVLCYLAIRVCSVLCYLGMLWLLGYALFCAVFGYALAIRVSHVLCYLGMLWLLGYALQSCQGSRNARSETSKNRVAVACRHGRKGVCCLVQTTIYLILTLFCRNVDENQANS